MEARLPRIVAAVVLVCALAGADHRTDNFTCNAASKEIAVRVCEAAERYRRDLAVEWLGRELPRWAQPCPITVQVGDRLGAGGATSFVFDRGEVFGWQMTIQGSLERVLDSVLPHEVTHAIFASHFRQPLPRWADEGACTTVEHESERRKQQKMLVQFLQTGRGIPFSAMFAMKEYPSDVLPLYAQGHSLTSYLLDRGGKKKFLAFLGEGMETDDWVAVLDKHYGITGLGQLQNTWLDWVAQGSPPAGPSVEREPVLLASSTGPTSAYAAPPAPSQPNQAATQVAAVAAPPVAKRARPEPNLIHAVTEGYAPATSVTKTPPPTAPSATALPTTAVAAVSSGLIEIGPGRLVPLGSPSGAATPIAAPAAPSDPFAGLSAAPPGMSSGAFTTAGHAPAPTSARQVILEWSQQPGPPQGVPNTTMRPTAPIYFDGALPAGSLVR